MSSELLSFEHPSALLFWLAYRLYIYNRSEVPEDLFDLAKRMEMPKLPCPCTYRLSKWKTPYLIPLGFVVSKNRTGNPTGESLKKWLVVLISRGTRSCSMVYQKSFKSKCTRTYTIQLDILQKLIQYCRILESWQNGLYARFGYWSLVK